MTATEKGLVHVAGVIDLAEAKMLIASGFGFLGFPLVLDHHEEDLSAKAHPQSSPNLATGQHSLSSPI